MAQSAPSNTCGERVAWVTGASRGVGRGIALAFGRAGWTVYVTARSSSAGRTGHLPGTVEDCAYAVTAAGGHGVSVVCDHRDDDAVAAVADRITATHHRLDLLVNNAWAAANGSMRERGKNGTPRCGSSRSSCSTRCSPAESGRTTSHWRTAHHC